MRGQKRMVRSHFGDSRMVDDISTVKNNMGRGDPDTIGQAHKKTVQKVPAAAYLGDNISAEKKDSDPKSRFNFLGISEMVARAMIKPKADN